MMHSQNSWTERLVSEYIRDQYINCGRKLIAPEARQELLIGACLYVTWPGSTTPARVYSDRGCTTQECNPVQFGSHGELIAPIFFPEHGEFSLRLASMYGETIASVENCSSEFEV